MADDKLNNNPAAPQDGDDTVTRKTIRLRPMAATASPAAPKPAAQPRPADNTDTGNIEIVDDTRTRKTIKLKPLASVKTASAPAPAPAAPAPAPAAEAAPVPAADGNDTVTRKTIKLKPMAVAAAKPKPAAAPTAEESGEKTIRIQRPVKPVTTGPAVSAKPVSAAPAAKPKLATPPQAVKVPSVQKPQLSAPPKPSVPTPVSGAAFEARAVGNAPSKGYLIMAALSLICLIYSTMLITVQFLDLTQKQNVAEQFPSGLLPRSK